MNTRVWLLASELTQCWRVQILLFLGILVSGQTGAAQDLQTRLKGEDPARLAKEAHALGDPARGAVVFFRYDMACARCHAPEDAALRVGPDLTQLPQDVTDVDLVWSILDPSKAIRKGYETTSLILTDGKTLTGLVAKEDDNELILQGSSDRDPPKIVVKDRIDVRSVSKVSLMPTGQVNQLSSRQQFLDLVRYLMELREGGPRRALELMPDPSLVAAPPLPDYEHHLDHAALVRSWSPESYERGHAIYQRVCANCHGTHDRPGSLPTALRFGEGKFKNGSEPLAMYRTITSGFGLMTPQTWMVPQQKYDVIYYIRQEYLKDRNPSQYFPVDDAYLAALPAGDTTGPEPSSIQPWAAMDYGISLINTYEVPQSAAAAGSESALPNLSYKGIAVRLDPGAGGVSRGRAWMLFDHDTFRMPAVWTGKGFIDWKGIQFDGQHAIHAHLVGRVQASNPIGPGWADPVTGGFDDPRLRGRDGRPYGPLPKTWGEYLGLYRHDDHVVISYRIGKTPILESPGYLRRGGTDRSLVVNEEAASGDTAPENDGNEQALPLRHFLVGPRPQPLTLVVATVPDAEMQLLASSEVAVNAWGSAVIVNSADETNSKPHDVADGLHFDGRTKIAIDHIEDFDLTRSDYTLLARIKTAHDGVLFSESPPAGEWKPDSKALFIRGGQLVFDMGWVGAVTSRSRVDDGEWHTVAMTWNRKDAGVRLFIDGKLDGGGELRPKGGLNPRAVWLGYGAEDFPSSTYFQGEIARLSFYPRRLSPSILEEAVAEDSWPEEPLAVWSQTTPGSEEVPDTSGGLHTGKLVQTKSNEATRPEHLVLGSTLAPSAATWRRDSSGRILLDLPTGDQPLAFSVWYGDVDSPQLAASLFTDARQGVTTPDLSAWTQGGSSRWPQIIETQAELGNTGSPLEVDVLPPPDSNPWLAQMRLTGFDFYPDSNRAAVCTWDGDVWIVDGLGEALQSAAPTGEAPRLQWRRIASGLFQPLGLLVIDQRIYVTCRDQIVILNDLNGDGETDFYECFNNDHQVTEHFHEFAMGLQRDEQGNLYYAKSGRHALEALVPHHGTLLRVTPDGSRTDILATGFRAANGVCLNPDGTFYVTDQEGFWTPKNRINLVRLNEDGSPKFYGNLWGYTDVTDPSDAAMEPPLCWITNNFDRSPAELLWVTSEKWKPLTGSLLNLSYGYGKAFLVLPEAVPDNGPTSERDWSGLQQGGMYELPLPVFPTGIMRGRFHPDDGQLYACGMFAWAGNATQPGGFYRIRRTEQPLLVPIEMHAEADGMSLTFSHPLQADSVEPENFAVKVWGLNRTENYGSPHVDEHALDVTNTALSKDGQTVRLTIPELAPTRGMEIRFSLTGEDGTPLTGAIDNTIHALPQAETTN